MDHLVYLDYKSKEWNYLLSKEKDIVLRGATGRKVPYGRVDINDNLYFCINNAEGLVKGKAVVKKVEFTDKLTTEASNELVDKYNDRIRLSGKALKRFRGKRYLSIIYIGEIKLIDEFQFDKSNHPNTDDWIIVDDINELRLVK